MLRSLLLLVVYFTVLFLGLRAPFVFGLGYLWTDLFTPQKIGYSLITDLPVSLIMAMATLGGYLALDRAHRPRFVPGIWLLLIWAAWMTITTTWAEVPDPAWEKWNWAFKTAVFAAFLPFLFRSRIQIEAAILVIVLSISSWILAAGAKVLAHGGGYGLTLGLVEGNSGLSEGSALALVSVSLIPIIQYCRKHSLIIPPFPFRTYAAAGLSVFAILTALGTYERTGLIAIGIWAVVTWWQSRRKIIYAILFVVAASLAFNFMGNRWEARMETVADPNSETSALGRIAVWMWTLGYVADHPLGGGFEVFRIDSYRIPIEGTNDTLEIHGKAFHSIYFEVLGEQGIPGLTLFAIMIFRHFLSMYLLMKKIATNAELRWAFDLAGVLIFSVFIYLCGGAFIGIGFQPFLWELIAIGIAVQQYVERYEKAQRVPVPSLIFQAERGPVRPVHT